MTEPAVTMFGRVEVSGRCRAVVLGGTNLPALLCLLASSPGRAVPNDRLIGALWPDADPARAHHSLTSLVHQLNQTIDPVLGTSRTVRTVKGVGRALRVDPATIDTVMFERGVADGEAHVASGRHDAAVDELLRAIRLWRGDPFGGLDLLALREAAAQLATTRARAESVLIDSALRAGRGSDLVDVLGPRLDAEPENEYVVGAMARALSQMGRRDEAAAVLHDCVALLRRRGIEPTPQLRRIELAIDAGHPIDDDAPAIPRRSRAQVPGALVGRHAERAAIGNWFVGATAPRSRGRVLVLGGEPGIGKTALMDAWLDGARDRVDTIRGQCSPEQVLPFQAFRPILDIAPIDETDIDATRPAISSSPIDKVHRRLEEMASDRTPLLAIDDAQWMTPTSVALLAEIVADDRFQRLRIILTARPHELAGNPPLAELLDRWRIDRCVEWLQIGPLSGAETEQLAARHLRLGAASAIAQPHALHTLTGGNPLFVIQVAQTGTGSPELAITVEHLLGRYLDGLAPGARRGVETAALLGIDGSLARLARCTGRDELAEIEALDSVGDGRLVDVAPAEGRYRFVHEIARQAVARQIPVGRSIRVHLAIADGLERDERPDVFALAHHLRLAVPAAAPARVATALLTASRRARELGDFDASRTLARQAFDATDDVATHADALVLMASGAQSMGEREAAARHIAAALDLALESNATQVLARALYVKSVVMGSWDNRDLALRITESVSAWFDARASRPSEDADLVEVVWALCLDKPGHALPLRHTLARRALQLARSSGDDIAVLQALQANQMVAHMMLSDPDAVVAWGTEALALASATRQPRMALLADSQILIAFLRAGRLDEARSVHERMVASQAETQDVIVNWAERARSAGFALAVDDLAAAERLIFEARAFGEPLGGDRPAQEYVNQMGVLHLARGSLPGLNRLFDAWFDQPPGPVWHWAAAPDELRVVDDPEQADRREVLVTNMRSPVPPHSEWLAELTIAAEYASRSRDADLAKVVAHCIEPFVHQHAVFGVAITLGSMWRPYALALAAAGDDRGARDAMATARLVNAGAGLTLWERLSRLPS